MLGINEISQVRFDAPASYCRHPAASVLATELRRLEFADERVLAALLLETDGESSAVILAWDLKERHRWIAMTDYFSSAGEALAAAERKVSALLPALDYEREQGDERGATVDFFEPVREAAKLNPTFVTPATEEAVMRASRVIAREIPTRHEVPARLSLREDTLRSARLGWRTSDPRRPRVWLTPSATPERWSSFSTK